MKLIKNPVDILSKEINEVSTFINFSNTKDGAVLSDFNLIHFLLEPGKESIKDRHNSKEYWFIMKGEGTLEINEEEKHHVKKGELYFFDSMNTHQIKNYSDSELLEILSIWW